MFMNIRMELKWESLMSFGTASTDKKQNDRGKRQKNINNTNSFTSKNRNLVESYENDYVSQSPLKIKHKPNSLCSCDGNCPRCSDTDRNNYANHVPPVIQTKLKVSKPHDEYEQKADMIADQILSSKSFTHENVQTYDENEYKNKSRYESNSHTLSLIKKIGNGVGNNASNNIDNPLIISALKEPGQPLDYHTKEFMESRFGYDFSNVRIHADSEKAGKSTDSVNALAYTVGNDIVFGKAQYNPYSTEGNELLTHELVHIVQQASIGQPLLHRYEAPEHKGLGDEYFDNLFDFLQTKEGEEWLKRYHLSSELVEKMKLYRTGKYGHGIKINNVQLTPGDVNALGADMLRSPGSFKSAKPEEINDLRKAIDKEKRGELSNPNLEYQNITSKYNQLGNTFLGLARDNLEHFSPHNIEKWKKLHTEAIDLAKSRGAGKKSLDEILLVDFFAGHYLADAFAAGHSFDVDMIMETIDLFLKRNPPKPSNPELNVYYLIIGSNINKLVLKNIHDHFNTVGFEVSNAKGMIWRSYGDNSLKKSIETQRIASLALFISRNQILEVYNGKIGPNFIIDDLCKEIFDLLPDSHSRQRATEEAKKYVPTAVMQVEQLLYKQRAITPKFLEGELKIPSIFAELIGSNLTTLSDPLRMRKLEDLQELGRKYNMPLIGTQLTFKEF